MPVCLPNIESPMTTTTDLPPPHRRRDQRYANCGAKNVTVSFGGESGKWCWIMCVARRHVMASDCDPRPQRLTERSTLLRGARRLIATHPAGQILATANRSWHTHPASQSLFSELPRLPLAHVSQHRPSQLNGLKPWIPKSAAERMKKWHRYVGLEGNEEAIRKELSGGI